MVRASELEEREVEHARRTIARSGYRNILRNDRVQLTIKPGQRMKNYPPGVLVVLNDIQSPRLVTDQLAVRLYPDEYNAMTQVMDGKWVGRYFRYWEKIRHAHPKQTIPTPKKLVVNVHENGDCTISLKYYINSIGLVSCLSIRLPNFLVQGLIGEVPEVLRWIESNDHSQPPSIFGESIFSVGMITLDKRQPQPVAD